jgi:hypothetical protein
VEFPSRCYLLLFVGGWGDYSGKFRLSVKIYESRIWKCEWVQCYCYEMVLWYFLHDVCWLVLVSCPGVAVRSSVYSHCHTLIEYMS